MSTVRGLTGVAESGPVYLSDSTHWTSVLTSASGTLFGGIGIAPQTPVLPFLTLCSSLSSAYASPAYFFEMSLNAGPTTFLSIEWQAEQLYLVASCIALESSTAATAADA